MARRTKRRTSRSPASSERDRPRRYCGLVPEPVRDFDANVHAERASLIRLSGNKWTNGTVLHYHFLNTPARWRGTEAHKNLVRDAFKQWKAVGIGLQFVEVDAAAEAEVRIGFQRDDGHWSYVGRGVLNQGTSERTMNLDKGDQFDIDTAMHEIGHTLGFPHEHQNPKSGIEWDEEKVYAELAKPPNRWSREKTFHNIIRKLDPETVEGSVWDPDSIMHYPFEAGLIRKPTKFQIQPLIPAPGLSARDKAYVKSFYPALGESDHKRLEPFRSMPLRLGPGQQADYLVEPAATREYTFSTFGTSDTVMALFEEVNGEPRFRVGDDDSGYSRNARFDAKLFAGRRYFLRVRLYWAHSVGETAVMMW